MNGGANVILPIECGFQLSAEVLIQERERKTEQKIRNQSKETGKRRKAQANGERKQGRERAVTS